MLIGVMQDKFVFALRVVTYEIFFPLVQVIS
jgi:hypothetical protein